MLTWLLIITACLLNNFLFFYISYHQQIFTSFFVYLISIVNYEKYFAYRLLIYF